MSFIDDVATAVPGNACVQEELVKHAQKLFDGQPATAAKRIFQRSRVRRRFLSRPPEFYFQPRPFSVKNADAVDAALAVSRQALESLARQSGLDLGTIGSLTVVNSTCLATPTLDALLMNQLPLPRDCRRTPLFGLGCAGGAIGISRAAVFAQTWSERPAVLLAVELCGHTLSLQDRSVKNLIATSLFGDGAAAVLFSGRQTARSRAQILKTVSVTFPDSLGVMGWQFSELGLGLVLAQELPEVVYKNLKPAYFSFLESAGVKTDQIRHYLVHPGGPKVIEAIRDSLGLTDHDLELTWRHLEEFGNLSSASVLFVLRDFLACHAYADGDLGVLMAMGPGFSAEFVLLRFFSQ